MEALGVMPDVTLLIIDECHTIRTKTAAYIKSNLKLKVIGLTATPFTKGMGKIYDNVVSTVTTKQLVAREVLVPLRVFIAKEIDMEGAKKSGGEWTNSEATARGKKITGDVVAEWIKVTHKIFNRPRKTLVFCSGTEHGVDLARKFQEQGYNFIATSHKDPDEWRKEILREFAEPDSKIHGLIATDLYTKGLDIPDVMIGVSARPFSKSFSSHVQQMGRITRGNPGSDKSFSVWICHSGNYLRFKDDWDEVYHNGVDELDDGKEKTKTEPTEFEKEAAKCPKCHALWAKGSDACYNCGFVREKQNMVYSVNGILTELQAPVIVKCDWDKQEFWSAMVWNMQHKGWKQGRAAKLFKDRFSEYQAPDLKNIPVKPSARIDLFAKNNLIAWQIKQKYLREHGR
jgi:superfamily II DNA or RNA helicase